MSKITDTYAEEIIDIIKDDTPFVALFEGDPETTGTEIDGGSYERKALSLGAVSGKQASTSGELRWDGMPASTVTHVAIYNASTEGTRRLSGALNSQVELQTNDEIFIPEGSLTVSASGA